MALFKFFHKFIPFVSLTKNKLVYLHIEKSAGTSQRVFFYENFGKENVFWYGINSDSNEFNPEEIKNIKILGGHRFFDFYHNSNYIYLAVVRDPIESVFSLYNFFITQQHHMDNWFKKTGFDSNSFENTLKNCAEFRYRIKNTQCRYLSKNKTFNEAIKTLNKHKFVLGCLSKLDLFNKTLIESLNIDKHYFPKINIGKAGYQRGFKLSQTSLNDLKELLKQDLILYHFILNDNNGLYNNVSQRDWRNLKLNNRHKQSNNST